MADRWDVTKAVRASDLPAPSRLVMLTLADVAEVGTAEIPEKFTPSLTVLAKETGLARSTVASHLAELERAGWITRIRPETVAALVRGERTRYRLSVPKTSPAEDLVREEDQPSPAPDKPSPGAGQPSPGAGHKNRSSYQSQISIRSSLPRKRSKPQPAEDKPSPRGTRIPDDFEVTDAMRAWAKKNVPQLAGAGETEKFVDYWRAIPGAKARKTDWVSTWRNWMRRAADDLATRKARASPAKPSLLDDPAVRAEYDKLYPPKEAS